MAQLEAVVHGAVTFERNTRIGPVPEKLPRRYHMVE